MSGSLFGHFVAWLSLAAASVVAAPVAAVAVVLALLAGCQHADTRGLRRVKVADGGVQIAYRLTPGTALAGHLRLGQTRQIDGLAEPLSQAVECDVTLVAAPRQPGAPQRLGASFANLDLAWGLPPSSSFASDEFQGRALSLAEAYEGWIEIDAQGRVLAVSPPPERTPPELAALLDTLMDAVEASFVPAPDGAVEPGAVWQRPLQRPPLQGEIQATLRGVYEHKARAEPVALLGIEYREERQAEGPSGAETRGRQGQGRVLYATDGGYVAEVDRELSSFAPSQGMTYEKLRVTWEIGRVLGPPPSPTEDVQIITDPCNPDYVGPELCPTDPSPDVSEPTPTDAPTPADPSAPPPTEPTPAAPATAPADPAKTAPADPAPAQSGPAESGPANPTRTGP